MVIISLVRSNRSKRVGFLKTKNRINVLLSRSQLGLYLIGNTETYSTTPMWTEILGMLMARNLVGTSLTLRCPRHTESELVVSTPEDFSTLSPEGGCQLLCNRPRSGCGHICEARCHSDSMHKIFTCNKRCERTHPGCGHSCRKNCGDDCGICKAKVDGVLLECGHTVNGLECYLSKDLSELSGICCNTPIQRVVPGCEHMVTIPCSENVRSPFFRCSQPCGVLLPCGHSCPKSYEKCLEINENGKKTTQHATCAQLCGESLRSCNHTRCNNKCQEQCSPCTKNCSWSCEHRGECSMHCSAPCDRLPCNERCSKMLRCGHQCPGLCGEVCLESYCLTCKDDGPFVSPIIALGCGHTFLVQILDTEFSISDVYQTDQDGGFTDLKEPTAFLNCVPKCPECKSPLRNHLVQRYNRLMNRVVQDKMLMECLTAREVGYHELLCRIAQLEDAFEGQ